MQRRGTDGAGMRLKAFLAAALAGAIAIGLALPVPHDRSGAGPKSPLAALELGRP